MVVHKLFKNLLTFGLLVIKSRYTAVWNICASTEIDIK